MPTLQDSACKAYIDSKYMPHALAANLTNPTLSSSGKAKERKGKKLKAITRLQP